MQASANALGSMFKPIIENAYLNVGAWILTQVHDSLHTMAEAIRDSVKAELPTAATTSIFEGLSGLLEISREIDEAEPLIKTALAEGGYPLFIEHLTLPDFAKLIGVDQVDPRVRNAVVTNKLLYVTRSDHFADSLDDLFQNSSILCRRSNIVKQALHAHQNRNYALSIPVLLAQAEGILTDGLVLKSLVIRKNDAHYVNVNKNGSPKLKKLIGLRSKIDKDNVKLQNEKTLKNLVDSYIEKLIPDRNRILHGADVSYATKAKLSVQLLLLIYMLSADLGASEVKS